MNSMLKHCRFPLSAVVALTLAACAGGTEPASEQELESVSLEETVRVRPNSKSGTLLVSAPVGDTLPNWSGSSSLYTRDTFKVYLSSNNALVTTGTIGSPVRIPRGSYKLVMNDTSTNVVVAAQQTSEVKASRIEVAVVVGTFLIAAVAPNRSESGFGLMNTTLPTGLGLNVFAGDYNALVTYQMATKSFSARVEAGTTILVQPADVRGTILLTVPTAELPDWTSTSTLYDRTNYKVFTETNLLVTTVALGQSATVPEGAYKIVLNDTVMTVNVTRQQTTTVNTGRIEVDTGDATGTFVIAAVRPTVSNSGFAVLNSDFPLGVGVNVLPGTYQVNITYSFGGTDSFPVKIQDVP